MDWNDELVQLVIVEVPRRSDSQLGIVGCRSNGHENHPGTYLTISGCLAAFTPEVLGKSIFNSSK